MVDFKKIRIDGKNRKVFFEGSCRQAIDLCQAMCCRQWDVYLDRDEFSSGLYRARAFCKLDKNKCSNLKISCANRGYQLLKKPDNSCIYLNHSNKCVIYKIRPRVCADFSCKGGWRLSSAAALNKDNLQQVNLALIDKPLRQNLRWDMIFILNPLIKIKKVLYLREKKELVLLGETVFGCKLSSFSFKIPDPKISDNVLFRLVQLFDGKNSLLDIYRSLRKNHSIALTKVDFLNITQLLFLRQIIIFKCPK